MVMTRWKCFLACLPGVLLMGCAAGDPLPDQPGLALALERYYTRHGIEEDGRCPLPEMKVTSAEITGRQGDRMTVVADYRWVDRRRGGGVAQSCLGTGTRSFMLYQGRVMSMSGEQR
jgi:hypothetical protein